MSVKLLPSGIIIPGAGVRNLPTGVIIPGTSVRNLPSGILIPDVLPLTPDLIFASSGGMAQWLQSDNVIQSANLISQITDLSGNGRHELPSGTTPTNRQPTWNSSDARYNGQPTITYNGEAEASANRDQTDATGWVRNPPLWTFIVMCQEGPNLGTNRCILADTVLNAFMLMRPSGSGSSVSTLVMRNAASNANSNTGIPDGTVGAHEIYYSNSLSTDYLLIKGLVSNGQNAGNLSGANERMGVTSAGNAWSFFSFALKIVTTYMPTMLQLSQVASYASGLYGSGILV